MPLMVQWLIVIVRGRLLTSAFGVLSVWMNIVRTAPAKACGWRLDCNLKVSIRGLAGESENVDGIREVC